MRSSLVESLIGQGQRGQVAERVATHSRELVEQTGERSSLRRGDMPETLKLVEGTPVTVLQDEVSTRQPVRAVGMDEVSHDIERTPRALAFVRRDPAIGKVAQQRVNRRRSAGEGGDSLLNHKRSSRSIRHWQQLPYFYTTAMILTTTPGIEGKTIDSYLGIVTGEAILGANIFQDLFANIRDIVGGRSAAYEGELERARQLALDDLKAAAQQVGANAVVGIDLDYEVLGPNNGMLMVSVSGTAVKLR